MLMMRPRQDTVWPPPDVPSNIGGGFFLLRASTYIPEPPVAYQVTGGLSLLFRPSFGPEPVVPAGGATWSTIA